MVHNLIQKSLKCSVVDGDIENLTPSPSIPKCNNSAWRSIQTVKKLLVKAEKARMLLYRTFSLQNND